MRALAIGLVLILVATLGGFYLYARVINGLFTRTNLSLQEASGGALNVLIVGSDSRAGLSDQLDIQRFGGSVGGQRSDTIMLAQVIPSQQRGVLLSIPRDSWVPIHENGHIFNGKINSAYNYGPQAVIDTVGALTGVRINHYMEVNIAGFRRMVDAIGGIDVCMTQRLYDSQLNFKLGKGMNHLDGNAALSFVRARHATADGDFGRIKRQQQFLRAVMSKVGRPTVLGNPVRVNQLARAFAENVKVDQFFQLNDLVRFALSVRKVGLSQLETYSVPGDAATLYGQSIVQIDQQRAEPLFHAMQNVQDPKALFPTPAPPPPAVHHAAAAAAAPHSICPPGST